METYFDYKRYFTPIERTKIAEELLLSETQIKTWFQNRRAKNKRDENEKREQVDKLSGRPQKIIIILSSIFVRNLLVAYDSF